MVLQHWSLHTVLEPVAFGLITAQHVYSHNMPQSKRSLPPPAEGRWQTGWVPRPQSYTQSLEEIERFFFLHLLRSTITSLLPMTRRIHKAQPCLIIVILMVSQRRQICLCIICSFLSHCILPTSAAVFKAQQGKHAELSCRTRHAVSDKGKEVPWVYCYHSQHLTCYRRGQQEAGYQGAEAQSQEIWAPQSVFLG